MDEMNEIEDKRQKAIRMLHQKLAIPDGYYHVPHVGSQIVNSSQFEPEVTPLTSAQRHQGFRVLKEAGIIDRTTEMAVMERLAERLMTLMRRADRKMK